jgi:hypothetical protein
VPPDAERVSTLNVLLTHLPAPEVEAQLAALRALAPESRFVVCHGGRRDEYERLGEADKAFVDDPTLRGEVRTFQSYHVSFDVVNERWLSRESRLDAVYLFEFDHLILRSHFEVALREIAERTDAGLLGKGAFARNGTNEHHYTRFRRDPALLEHIRRLTVRDDPTRLYGVLACAMWLSRAAIESYLSIEEHPPCYGELYVPTVLHHLGHRIVDVDAESDLYRHVRWTPPYDGRQAEALRGAGATFVHPVKDPAARRRLLATAVAELRPTG